MNYSDRRNWPWITACCRLHVEKKVLLDRAWVGQELAVRSIEQSQTPLAANYFLYVSLTFHDNRIADHKHNERTQSE